MEKENYLIDNWYSAQYAEGFSIIFQAVKTAGSTILFLRKDGTIIDAIPTGYTEIIPHGITEPEY